MKILLGARSRHLQVDPFQLRYTEDFIKLKNEDPKAYYKALYELANAYFIENVLCIFLAPDIPEEILELVYDKYENTPKINKIVEQIIKYPDTPEYLLDKCAESKVAYYRKLVASRPDLSEDIILKLSEDSNSNVKIALAYNYTTPVEILEKLTQDLDKDVSQAATRELEYRQRMHDYFMRDNA